MVKVKQDRGKVLPTALIVRDALRPVCAKLTIAGGLRREQARVGDIDLVCCPNRDRDLFGAASNEISGLEGVLEGLMRENVLQRDLCQPKWGEKLRRFIVPALSGLPLELYITTPANHGYILMVRTGDEAFATAMVTARRYGGLLPDDMGCIDGHLYRFPSARLAEEARKRQSRVNGELLPCPREETFFAHIGLRSPAPHGRSEAGLSCLQRLRPDEQAQLLSAVSPQTQRHEQPA